MGNPPKPTALKLLEGNRGKRRLPKDEPKPRPITPDPPEYLNEDGLRRWNELLPELDLIGTLTVVDGGELGRYCYGYQCVLEGTRRLAKQNVSMVSKRGTGGQMVNPWVLIIQQGFENMAKAGIQLGIGAANRTKIEVKKPDAGKTPLEAVREATRRK